MAAALHPLWLARARQRAQEAMRLLPVGACLPLTLAVGQPQALAVEGLGAALKTLQLRRWRELCCHCDCMQGLLPLALAVALARLGGLTGSAATAALALALRLVASPASDPEPEGPEPSG